MFEKNELSEEMTVLKEVAERMTKLLSDPNPGLSTWNAALRNACIDMQAALCSLGCTPNACGIESKD